MLDLRDLEVGRCVRFQLQRTPTGDFHGDLQTGEVVELTGSEVLPCRVRYKESPQGDFQYLWLAPREIKRIN